jgi:hypothetical protein
MAHASWLLGPQPTATLEPVSEADGPVALPNPKQVAALRDFIHGRSYQASAATLRLPDDPPLVAGSPLARTSEVNQSLFGLVTKLSQSLLAELRAEEPAPISEILWRLLLQAAKPWRDDPDLPEDVREAVAKVDEAQ